MARRKDDAHLGHIVTPIGVAVYPRITGDPDTRFDPDGAWKGELRLEVPRREVQALMIDVQVAYKKYAERQGLKLRKAGLPWKEDPENEGCILVKAKLSAVVRPKNKEPFTQRPVILDSRKNKLPGEELMLASGTELRFSCEIRGYEGFGGGVSLRLKAAQVFKLVEFDSDFGFDDAESDNYPAIDEDVEGVPSDDEFEDDEDDFEDADF